MTRIYIIQSLPCGGGQQRNLHIAFIEFIKVFDCVNRELLFKPILGKLGCPAKFKRDIIPKLDPSDSILRISDHLFTRSFLLRLCSIPYS